MPVCLCLTIDLSAGWATCDLCRPKKRKKPKSSQDTLSKSAFTQLLQRHEWLQSVVSKQANDLDLLKAHQEELRVLCNRQATEIRILHALHSTASTHPPSQHQQQLPRRAALGNSLVQTVTAVPLSGLMSNPTDLNLNDLTEILPTWPKAPKLESRISDEHNSEHGIKSRVSHDTADPYECNRVATDAPADLRVP